MKLVKEKPHTLRGAYAGNEQTHEYLRRLQKDAVPLPYGGIIHTGSKGLTLARLSQQ